jgi:hypothetical protein
MNDTTANRTDAPSILPPKGAFGPIPYADPVAVLRLVRDWAGRPLHALLQVVGGLSSPSKMPCYGYSIPAKYCAIGQILAKMKGTVCSGCYADDRGRYAFANVKLAMLRRFRALRNADEWCAAMVLILSRRLEGMRPGSKIDHRFMRWHDSGDIQSVEHLHNIALVHSMVPGVHGWLPTREYGILREYERLHGALPANLTARASAHKIEEQAPDIFARRSMVVTHGPVPEGVSLCPAPMQGNACRDCRACWTAPQVAYILH